MSKKITNKLYYIHDPMCSWCWGFHPVLQQLENTLAGNIKIEYILGGLAADSDLPMPEKMQTFLQKTWHTIQTEIPGTSFNFEFWKNCSPRRSTYAASRAVIAARLQAADIEKEMIHQIQIAYYCQAKNPSDDETLIDIASQLGLDSNQFTEDLNADTTQQVLEDEIKLAHELGVQGFPSLVLETSDKRYLLDLDYRQADAVIRQIETLSD